MPSEPDPIPTASAEKQDVGSVLRAERLKKKHSIEAVAAHTRIPRRLLESLEANRTKDFPAKVYLRGFLKNYCDYLDLDFAPLWTSLRDEISPPPPPPPADEEDAPEESDSTDATSPTEAFSSAAGGLFAAALLAIGLLVWSHREKPTENAPEPPPLAPAAIRPVNAPAQPELSIYFRRDVWLRLEADGRTEFEGRVPAGSRQSWTAHRIILLWTSDSEALSLRLNGSDYSLGRPDSRGRYRIAPY